jgi:hypothetical protein
MSYYFSGGTAETTNGLKDAVSGPKLEAENFCLCVVDVLWLRMRFTQWQKIVCCHGIALTVVFKSRSFVEFRDCRHIA